MPIALVHSISLPNLKIYTTISLLLLSGCFYYAFDVVRTDPHWKLHQNLTNNFAITRPNLKQQTSSDGLADNEIISSLKSSLEQTIDEEVDKGEIVDVIQEKIQESVFDESSLNQTQTLVDQLKEVAQFMTHEPICIWTLINMAYCCLILLGKSIQKIVFGELRISEQQHMKDKFWNFIFYKFIFVFGIVNVQYLHEIVLWVGWFTAIGFLHLMAQLCKDRFEYLSFSPTTPGWSHFRLIALLSSIFTISGIMIIVSIVFGLFNGINMCAFMGAECFILAIRTLHVLIRYGMFLYDMRQGAINNDSISWDKRGSIAYYTEFGFDLAALLVDLAHHLHMLLWSNIFLSMASLVIIMQLRYLANEIQRKFKKHRNYLWVLKHMEKNYKLATADDLQQNSDNCAICWEKMLTARKLPCSHLFHESCLQSWLEQDQSCPTCRLALSVQSNRMPSNRQPNVDIDEIEQWTNGTGGPGVNGNARNNHFFHFNGQRYISWLPNFSVEVSNINSVLRNGHLAATLVQQQQQTSQLRNMARHIQEMFPHYTLDVLISDLQVTHSIEHTIDNILEGRLPAPRIVEVVENQSSPSTPFVPTNDFSNYSNLSDESPSSSSTSSSSSSTDQYDIEQHGSNSMFGNQFELLRDTSPESQISDPWTSNPSSSEALGNRFSKSSQEREKILQKRKEQMLIVARKRYLEKTKSGLNLPSSSTTTVLNSQTSSSGTDLRHRTSTNNQE
jgi:autocrine motility factor receptor